MNALHKNKLKLITGFFQHIFSARQAKRIITYIGYKKRWHYNINSNFTVERLKFRHRIQIYRRDNSINSTSIKQPQNAQMTIQKKKHPQNRQGHCYYRDRYPTNGHFLRPPTRRPPHQRLFAKPRGIPSARRRDRVDALSIDCRVVLGGRIFSCCETARLRASTYTVSGERCYETFIVCCCWCCVVRFELEGLSPGGRTFDRSALFP